MIVYCDAEDCKSNQDGKCNNKWPNGVEAIKLEEAFWGMNCSDYDEVEHYDRSDFAQEEGE